MIFYRVLLVCRVGCGFLKEKYIIINLNFIVILYGVLGFFKICLNFLYIYCVREFVVI